METRGKTHHILAKVTFLDKLLAGNNSCKLVLRIVNTKQESANLSKLPGRKHKLLYSALIFISMLVQRFRVILASIHIKTKCFKVALVFTDLTPKHFKEQHKVFNNFVNI